MRFIPFCLVAFLSLSAVAADPHPSLPRPVIPECLGVNIHFTDPKPGELEMLAAAGFKWVRMDLGWGATERKKGEYDFSAYDRLVAALDRHKLRAVFILDYGNPLYAEPGDKHPFTSRAGTEEFRAAYGRWAAAVVTHFQKRGYLWELWNEPNHSGFWKPQPDAAEYAAVALAGAKAIRAAAPEEAIIGPATSTIDLPFLEKCFQTGLLEYLDAVSVHPYRQTAPENAAEEYRNLRLLIAKYRPKDKVIPVISGEWGYSTAWKNFDDARQGKYLPRELLTNVANDIALSIWYDWHDDGTDPKEPEHHFGIVGHEYHAGRDPVYDPKPAYVAMKTLFEQLGGWRFNKQLSFGFDQELLLFTRGNEVRVAWWGKSRAPLADWMPASPGEFSLTDAFGKALPPVLVQTEPAPKLETKISDGVLYARPDGPNDLLRIAAAWERLPLEVIVDPKEKTSLRGIVRNPLAKALPIVWEHGAIRTLQPGEELPWNQELAPSRRESVISNQSLLLPGLGNIGQSTRIMARAPVRLTPYPCLGATLSVRVENPSGEAFTGKLRLAPFDTADWGSIDPLVSTLDFVETTFAAGEREKIFRFPLGHAPRDFYGTNIVLDEGGNEAVMSFTGACRRVTLDTGDSAHAIVYQMLPEGDPKVGSRQSLTEDSPTDLPPYLDGSPFKVRYAFEAGWKFISLSRSEIGWPAIPGQPTQFGLWIYGDGHGLTPRIRFVDQSGQTFQADGTKIDWIGWRFITFPLQRSARKPLAHWGGRNDGEISYPIQWNSVLLLDNTDRRAVEGEVYFCAPTLIY